MCIRQYSLAQQNVLWVSHGKALPARYSRDTAVSIWLDSSHFSMCRAHELLRGMLSHEIPAKTSSIFNSLSLYTLSLSITQPLQSSPTINTWYKRLSRIIIKFLTELNPNKIHSCKLQLYKENFNSSMSFSRHTKTRAFSSSRPKTRAVWVRKKLKT